MRLLRTTRSGIFRRSFPLHSPRYARETIAEICSLGVALATAIISQTGSWISKDHEQILLIQHRRVRQEYLDTVR